MPLTLKTFQDLFRSINSKFNKEIPSIDPTIKESMPRASSGSTAAAGIGLQEGLKDAQAQMFWQDANGEFLEKIGEYDGTIKFDAQPANGFCAVEGVLSTIIPADTQLTANGNTYLVLQDSGIQNYLGSVFLSYSAGIVTAVTSAIHSLSSNLTVTITNAIQTDYNGSFVITVLDENTFTYELPGVSLSSDNGDYTAVYALLNIESQETGQDKNLDAGAQLTIDVTDVDDIAYVGVDRISGGLEEEIEDDYRDRVGENHNITPSIGAPPSILASVKSIPGNTRVFIIRPVLNDSGGTPGQAGYKPEINEVVIYVLRDNDENIIPSQAILTETKNKIISDGQWPSWLPDDNLYVMAPNTIDRDFVFASITPNTSTMQNAIRSQLVSFFEDNATINGTTELKTIDAFLGNSIQDPDTGDFLTSYNLTSPSADLVDDTGEISVMGVASFG